MYFLLRVRGEEEITQGRYPTYLRAERQRDRAQPIRTHDVAVRWHALWLCFPRPPFPGRRSRR
eukprot:6211889-Pleurochrysis_carterae.AAC.1